MKHEHLHQTQKYKLFDPMIIEFYQIKQPKLQSRKGKKKRRQTYVWVFTLLEELYSFCKCAVNMS